MSRATSASESPSSSPEPLPPVEHGADASKLAHARRLRRTWLALILGTYALYVVSPVKIQTDSIWTIPTAASIVNQGNTDLDEYQERIALQWHGVEKVNGHLYNSFPIGPVIAALPFVAVFDSLVHGLEAIGAERIAKLAKGLHGWESHFHAVGKIDYGWFNTTELLIASFYTALAVGFVFLAAARRSSLEVALGVAVLFAFGTCAYATASRVLWQHGPSLCAISAAIYLLTRPKQTWQSLLLLGVTVAASYVVRPTNSLTVLAVSAYVLWTQRTRAWPYFAGAAVIALPFCGHNLALYGTLLPPYFQAGRLHPGTALFLEALAGNLVSPARGLFVYSPFLLFAVASFVARARRRSLSLLEWIFGGIVVVHWFAISAFPHWWGGHSVGNRFFCDVLPYFAFFLVEPVAAALRNPRTTRVFSGALALTAAFGIFVNASGAWAFSVHGWNDGPPNVDEAPSRIWSLHDPQFLRGLHPHRKAAP